MRESIEYAVLPHYDAKRMSLRDIEEQLLERGVSVTYESVGKWRDRFGASYARCAKAVRGRPATIWHLDELFLVLRGEPYVLWRAGNEQGMELDALLRKRRDKTAAKRFVGRTCAQTRYHGRSLPTSCAANRRQRQRWPNWAR